MANEIKDRLVERLRVLKLQRAERATEFAAQLQHIDGQISAIMTLANQWDTLTVDQALALLAQTGIALDLKS